MLDTKYAGSSVNEKLTVLRKELVKENCPALILSALDQIAWLFNLRGSDIKFNPGMYSPMRPLSQWLTNTRAHLSSGASLFPAPAVFMSYAIITPSAARLFVKKQQLGAEVVPHLKAADVSIEEYDDFFDLLSGMSLSWEGAS